MGLYGLFPETDRFTAVVCDCGVVVKPQGLKNHLARNHSGSLKYSSSTGKPHRVVSSSHWTKFNTIFPFTGTSYFGTSGNNGSSYARSSSSNSPASSTSSTPVKNPEDFSGILPALTRHHKHGSSKLKKVAKSGSSGGSGGGGSGAKPSASIQHSSDSLPMPVELKSTGSMPEFVINATSTSLDSSTYTFPNSKVQNLSPGTLIKLITLLLLTHVFSSILIKEQWREK